MVVPRRADFDFRATSASRVALDSIEQPTDADTADLPALPEEVWTYIFEIRAATTIQAKVRGFKTRHGPIRYLLIYVKKGWLPPARAVFWATELQTKARCAPPPCLAGHARRHRQGVYRQPLC
mmetsp:Transcript_70443/g.211868  ORF Transcript_70443/g.211868 Transcript_70443/m.211868 type:complete len:123 (+) Transcript_70443:337-705(+)